MMESIYGQYESNLERLMQDVTSKIEQYSKEHEEKTGEKMYEHLSCRIKSDGSMREKLKKKSLPENAYSALRSVKDSVGFRIVCLFIDDVYQNVEKIRNISGCKIVKEKDYIKNVKPNGYRSYHMILDFETEFPDIEGNVPGHYYVEVQLRTIAMDTWAALEHELKYKKNISNPEIILSELGRCANELASCDVSMQTIKNMIRED